MSPNPTAKHTQPSSTPPQISHASLSCHLISDLAPELPLPWIISETFLPPCKQRSIPPAIPRALISILLRAASRLEADAAYDTLQAIVRLPETSPATCLGFSAEGVAKENLTEILCELVTSASREEPLLPSGDVLSFYNEAGHGAADADEFQNALPERRDLFLKGEHIVDVRVANLARFLDVVACAFRKGAATSERLVAAVKGTAVFMMPLFNVLPTNIALLDVRLVAALKELYAAYLQRIGEGGRADVVTNLVGTFMGLAAEKVENLAMYINVVADPELRFRVCRMCLVQRYKVRDDIEGRFGLPLLERYLAVRPREGNLNKALPVLLAAFIISWFEIADKDDFRVKDTAAFINRIQTPAKRIQREFGAAKGDVICFRVAVLALCNRIMSCHQRRPV